MVPSTQERALKALLSDYKGIAQAKDRRKAILQAKSDLHHASQLTIWADILSKALAA